MRFKGLCAIQPQSVHEKCGNSFGRDVLSIPAASIYCILYSVPGTCNMKMNRTGLCLQGAESLVEHFKAATKRNICRLLKGFMAVSPGRWMVCGLPDRGESKDRGPEARHSLVACAVCSCSIRKGEHHVGNLTETFQSGPSVILCLLPQWSFNLVGLPRTSAFLPSFFIGSRMNTKYSLLPGLPLAHCNRGRFSPLSLKAGWTHVTTSSYEGCFLGAQIIKIHEQ